MNSKANMCWKALPALSMGVIDDYSGDGSGH